MARPRDDVKEAWATAFESVAFNLMDGMTKAGGVEERFVKLRVSVQMKTRDQLKKIAKDAGEYYAEHANPDPSNLTEDECDRLLAEAIEYALKKFSDE